MDRRGFLLGAGALALAGCARVAPAGARPSPSPTPTAPPLAFGDDGTAAGAMLAHLLARAVPAGGRAASVVQSGEDWQAALGDGTLAALPAYAATLWAGLSDAGEPPTADQVVTDVADLVAPEVSTLAVPKVDGGLVWLVTQKTADAGLTGLDRIGPWSKGKVVAVPNLAVSRGDGVPGLQAVYGASFTVVEVEDPLERAARLTSGAAGVAAFRRAEYTGASGLVALEDPDQFAVADPLVILLHAALADAEPDAVLAFDAVAKALTTDTLIDLQAKVAAGADRAEVAKAWLAEHGLA